MFAPSQCGVQPTFGVQDLAAATSAVEAKGDRVVPPEYRIEGVGNLIYFEDAGAIASGAMRYDDDRLWPPCAGTQG